MNAEGVSWLITNVFLAIWWGLFTVRTLRRILARMETEIRRDERRRIADEPNAALGVTRP